MTRILTILLAGCLLAIAPRAISQEAVPDDQLVVDGFRISGNKVTKERIIIREMVFAQGDTLLKMDLIGLLQRSKDNLLNTSLFNFVFLDVEHLEANHILVEISVTERWYIWPVPILEYAERNFNEFITNREWDKLVYGAWLRWNNFRGRNDALSGKIRLGYITEYALDYQAPNLGRRQQHALQGGFSVDYQNEVAVTTEFNRPVEYQPSELPAQINYNLYTKYTLRRKYYSRHSIRMEFQQHQASDSVVFVNSNYLGRDPETGEALTALRYFKLSYEFRHDARDSRIYPLEGIMVKMIARQVGLGFIPDFPYPTLQLTGVLMVHQQLRGRFYFYNTTKVRYSSEKRPPHILNKGLGYNEWLSAYEPYVIDGSDYFISRYNLKFELVRPTTRTLPLIGMEQFNKIHYAVYLNLFADAGYVHNEFPDPTNTMANTFQFSSGIGLDLVTYYDQVFRIDVAINRYGEYGVFFHLETPFFRW